MSFTNRFCIALFSLCISNFANATLINVSEIRISSAVNDWLQVSELVAWSDSTGSDLALVASGATATATDFYLGNRSCNLTTSNANCAIDGNSFVDYPNIFHGGQPNTNTVLSVMLNVPSSIDWIEIYGRNGCCQERDVYNISFFNETGKQIYSLANVDGSTTTAQNRIAVSEPSVLALLGLGLFALGMRRRFKK
jgi:hypothetical protein